MKRSQAHPVPPEPPPGRYRRRDVILAAGGLGLGGLLGGRLVGLDGAEQAAAATCVLTPEATEGPYWIDDALTRRDIRAGRRGLRLDLVLAVQNARTCRPLRNADVEIWHCDAGGLYSGFESASRGGPGGSGPTDAKRYLRGHQRTDSLGRARFTTIFPGWYRGRTPHIHLKVHAGGDVVHTGQIFFSERVQTAVYRTAPYSSHGQPDTSHAADMIYASAGGSRSVVRLTSLGAGTKGYRGTITLGVATS